MRLPILLAALTLPFLAGAAAAQTALPGSAAFCANCHGTDGKGGGDIPLIAGLPSRILADKLKDFRAEKVPGATVMPRLIKGLTDQEIQAAADYFSRIR